MAHLKENLIEKVRTKSLHTTNHTTVFISLEQTKKSFKLEAGSWTGDVWPIRYYKYVFKTA